MESSPVHGVVLHLHGLVAMGGVGERSRWHLGRPAAAAPGPGVRGAGWAVAVQATRRQRGHREEDKVWPIADMWSP
jgi:hypothetical protein